jgi:thioredoxin-dependent peroxiredoxin
VPVKGEYAARQSFLIGRDGKVARIWREVSPEGHAEEVLAAAR